MAHVALKSPGVSGAHRTSMRIGSFTPWYTVRSVSLPAGQIESDQMLDRWWQWSRRRIASIDINSQMMPNVSPRSQNSWEKMTGTRSVSIKIQSDSQEFSILIPQIHHGAQKLPKWDAMDKDCQGALSQAKDVWNSMDQPERSLTFGPRKELKLDESFVLAMSTLSSLSAEFQRWFFDGQGLAVSEFIIHKIKSLNIQSLGNKWSFWQFMNPLRNFRHRMGGTSIGCLWSTKGCLWKYWVFAGCFGSFSRVPGCFFLGRAHTPNPDTELFPVQPRATSLNAQFWYGGNRWNLVAQKLPQVISFQDLQVFAGVCVIFFSVFWWVILGASKQPSAKTGLECSFPGGYCLLALPTKNDAMGDLMDTHPPIPKFQMAHWLKVKWERAAESGVQATSLLYIYIYYIHIHKDARWF